VFSACGCWIFHWMGLYSVRLLASSKASRNLFLILLAGISGFGRELIVDGERKQREAKRRGCGEEYRTEADWTQPYCDDVRVDASCLARRE